MTQQVTTLEPRVGCGPDADTLFVGDMAYPCTDYACATLPRWDEHAGQTALHCVGPTGASDPLVVGVPEPPFVLGVLFCVGLLVLLVWVSRGGRDL